MKSSRIRGKIVLFLLLFSTILHLPPNQADCGHVLHKETSNVVQTPSCDSWQIPSRTTEGRSEQIMVRKFLSWLKQGACHMQEAAQQTTLGKHVQRRHLHELRNATRKRHGRCRVAGCAAKATHSERDSTQCVVCKQHKLSWHVARIGLCTCSFPEG